MSAGLHRRQRGVPQKMPAKQESPSRTINVDVIGKARPACGSARGHAAQAKESGPGRN